MTSTRTTAMCARDGAREARRGAPWRGDVWRWRSTRALDARPRPSSECVALSPSRARINTIDNINTLPRILSRDERARHGVDDRARVVIVETKAREQRRRKGAQRVVRRVECRVNLRVVSRIGIIRERRQQYVF